MPDFLKTLLSPADDDCRNGLGAGEVPLRSACGAWVLAATVLGSAMVFLDQSVVNVALPVIGRDLSAAFAGLQWVVDAYLLALGSLLLLGGRLGDLYGRRLMFVVGLLGFATASGLAAASPVIFALIGARAIQGIAAALMVPGSLAIIASTFRKKDRGTAIGAWSGLTALSTAAGPLLGGWIVEASTWRLIFLINLPVALAAAFIAWRHVPESRDRSIDELDLSGAASAVFGLGSLVFFAIEGPRLGWSHPAIPAALLVGVALTAAFFFVERRKDQPLLPLGVFRSRQFAGANGATLTTYAALQATFFLLVLMLQGRIGYSPLAAGAALTPVTILLLVMSPLMGNLTDRIGPRLPMTVGPLIVAAGLILLSRVSGENVEPTWGSYFRHVFPAVFVFGVGLGTNVAPLTTAALTALAPSRSGLASGTNNAAARVAGLLGIALIPLAAGIAGRQELDSAAFAQGFGRAMWIAAGLAVLGATIALLTVPGRSSVERNSD